MKKLVLFSLVALFSTTSFSQQNAISKYFSDYNAQEEFTKVEVSGKMFELAEHIAVEDANDQELMEALPKIEGLTLLAQEDIDNALDLFKESSKRPGSEFEELMTINDKDAQVKFLINESNGIVTEMLVFFASDREFGLVDVWGEIDLAQVGKLASAFQMKEFEHFDEELAEKKRFVNYYPNPIAVGQVGTLEIPESLEGCQMKIHDFSGKLISEEKVNSTSVDVNLSGLAAGTYVLTLYDGSTKFYSEKIFIER